MIMSEYININILIEKFNPISCKRAEIFIEGKKNLNKQAGLIQIYKFGKLKLIKIQILIK